MIKTKPIRQTGLARRGTLTASYQEIVDAVGPPNVTDMDDYDKVKASWGFVDADDPTLKGFIWCYKHLCPESCTSWSVDGDLGYLDELFPFSIS